MRKKSFFRKGLEKIILTASGLLLLNSINTSQTTNLTFSGEVKTKTEMERPLQVPINIEQLVSGSWQPRTNTTSNEQGEYEVSTVITGMKEHQALTPMNYITLDNKGFLSATDNTQLTHAVYTLPLMQEILKEQINLKQGNNDLPKNNFHGLANTHYFETYSNKHGIISRLITIQNSQITHESVKGNRTIKMPVTNSRNNNDDFEKAQKTQASQASQNFQNSDSLYFRIITNPKNLEGNLKQYKADTTIASTPKDAPTNITNQKHKLNLKDNYISVQLWYVTSLGEINANKELPTNISGVLDTTFYSNTNGLIDITFKKPNTENQEITITFPNYEDKLNARVIHKKGSMLDQKPVAITEYQGIPDAQVYNEMRIQNDSLQKAHNETDLALFDFKSKYRTNDYAGGYLDLDNPEHRGIYKESGRNMTWTSEHTDTLFIITSDINQHYGTPAHEIEIQERDTVLTDLKKVLNLEGTPLEEWKRVNYSGPHKVDDINDNDLKDRILEEYGGYNYADIYFGNHDGNSQSVDSLYRLKRADISFGSYSTPGNKVSEIFAGILNCRDPPTISLGVGDYFLATDIAGYNNTQLTEACWGMTQQKLLLPQGYPLGR